jgi:hypothetical protein
MTSWQTRRDSGSILPSSEQPETSEIGLASRKPVTPAFDPLRTIGHISHFATITSHLATIRDYPDWSAGNQSDI